MKPAQVVVAGLGYFSQFHVKAWSAHPDASLVGLCDPDPAKLQNAPTECATATSLDTLLEQVKPDIIDIIAPPTAHATLIHSALATQSMIICQKPFARTREEATTLAAQAKDSGTTLVIHENFRFQPWHRATKAALEAGRLGDIYSARFDLRPGDGRGPEAYLARQPAFRAMPRFLFHETGVHFVDLFRWLFGPITSVYAEHQRLNPGILGEDFGLMIFQHASGTRSVFDGNRLSDHAADNTRLTMGEMRIEGEHGTLDLNGTGALSFRAFGAQETTPIPFGQIDADSFGGGCVAALINHVLEARRGGQTPENTAAEYLPNLDVVEAAYRSAQTGQRISL